LRAAGQIPVERLSKNAIGAFDAAVQAVRAGECVVVYPEGTLTRDPDLWPMVGKSGAARIALETGAPVIPIGQWAALWRLNRNPAIEDVLQGKLWAVQDTQRRASKRQKDLADIAELEAISRLRRSVGG